MRALLLASCLVVLGCSSSSSSSSSSDAGADAAPEPKLDTIADWTCIGKVKTPTPASATTPFDFALVDPLTNKPLAGATVKTCARTDAACASPFETATTDDTGTAKLAALPTGTTGFDGFFEVRYGSEIPNLNFQEPIFAKYPGYCRLYWGDAQLGTILRAGGFQADLKNLGSLGFEAHDCKEMPGGVSCRDSQSCAGYTPGGITAEIDVKDPKIVRGFIVYENGVATVSTAATSTSAIVGKGGFFNVPPGPVTLTLKVEATGQVVAVHKVHVRAGAITLITAQPTN